MVDFMIYREQNVTKADDPGWVKYPYFWGAILSPQMGFRKGENLGNFKGDRQNLQTFKTMQVT